MTEDVGHLKLREHLASVVALMKASDDWDQFVRILNRALPKYAEMPLFDLPQRHEQRQLTAGSTESHQSEDVLT